MAVFKSRIFLQFAALSVVNIWLAVALVFAARQTLYHWNELLGDEVAISSFSEVTLNAALIWPFVLIIVSLAGAVAAAERNASPERLEVAFTVLVLSELLLMSWFVVGAIEPSISISYRLGS